MIFLYLYEYHRAILDNINMIILNLALIFGVYCAVAGKEVITTQNLYEIRRPIRYQYYRMNIKSDINPLVSHLADPTEKYCSSKLGPFCGLANTQNFMEYTLKFDQNNQDESVYYRTQKYRLKAKRDLAYLINSGEENLSLLPSGEYIMIDQEIRFNIDSLMNSQQILARSQRQKTEHYKSKQQRIEKMQKQLQQRRRNGGNSNTEIK